MYIREGGDGFVIVVTNPRSNKQNFFSQLNQHELKMMKVTLLCLATLLAAPVPGQGQPVR